MWASTLLLLSAWTQSDAVATSPRAQQLADRFVAVVTRGPREAIDLSAVDGLGEHLLRTNPGREAEAARIARSATDCLSRGFEQTATQAAREAALAFDEHQLERLIAFVEMRHRTPPGPVAPEWQDARRDYGRWMYSLPLQPAVVAMMQRCNDETIAAAARAGLRVD